MNQQFLISKYKDYIKYLLHRQYITVEKKRQIYKMVCNMNNEIERLENELSKVYKILDELGYTYE